MRAAFSKLINLIVSIDDIPVGGQELGFSANAGTLDFLRENSDVTNISRFDGNIRVCERHDGFLARGRLHADIEQKCVVSLETVSDVLAVDLNGIFRKGAEPEAAVNSRGEVFVDLETTADAEWFEGAQIDLSFLVLESYLLALDPYPRKERAGLVDVNLNEANEGSAAFAVLSKFRRPE